MTSWRAYGDAHRFICLTRPQNIVRTGSSGTGADRLRSSIHTNPRNNLKNIRGGELRVGVSPNEDWVQIHDSGDPTGTEPELLTNFAASLGSRITWVPGGEESLMTALESGKLDLVAGGLSEKTP